MIWQSHEESIVWTNSQSSYMGFNICLHATSKIILNIVVESYACLYLSVVFRKFGQYCSNLSGYPSVLAIMKYSTLCLIKTQMPQIAHRRVSGAGRKPGISVRFLTAPKQSLATATYRCSTREIYESITTNQWQEWCYTPKYPWLTISMNNPFRVWRSKVNITGVLGDLGTWTAITRSFLDYQDETKTEM